MYTICIKLNFTTFGRNKFGVAEFYQIQWNWFLKCRRWVHKIVRITIDNNFIVNNIKVKSKYDLFFFSLDRIKQHVHVLKVGIW